MLYFFHGTDTQKIRKNLDRLVTILKTKKPLAPIVRLTQNNFSIVALNQSLGEQSLFTEKNIVILDSLLKEHIEILESLEDIQKSEHICILIEGKVSEKNVKTITPYAEKIEEHNEVEKRERHINFEITDALSVRDMKRAWSLYVEVGEGITPEEIHGTLMWQLKTLILATKTESAKDAGISPYAYQKAKSASKFWNLNELVSIQNHLFKMYHDARRGSGDLALSMEGFFLR